MSRLLERTAAELANPSATNVTVLPYSQIRTNGGTQMRAGVNEETAGEYADELRRGGLLPPVVVFHDGSEYWLGDGFHRVRAHFMANGSAAQIPAEVRPGTRRDAVLCAAGANAVHGLRRTRADKERAVDALLRDEEWGQWSDREIARRCHVSPTFVGERRKIHTVHVDSMNGDTPTERTFVHHKTGQPTTMNTTGQRAAADEAKRTRIEYWLLGKGWSMAHGLDGELTMSRWFDGETISVREATKAETIDAAERREKAIIAADKATNEPVPSPLRTSLDHTDQVMAAEVGAVLADDAPWHGLSATELRSYMDALKLAVDTLNLMQAAALQQGRGSESNRLREARLELEAAVGRWED